MGFSWVLTVNHTVIATGSGTMPKGIERTTPRQSGLAGIYAGVHTARSITAIDWTKHDPKLDVRARIRGQFTT